MNRRKDELPERSFLVDIVLASGSPRRAELLRQIKLPFTIQVSSLDENSIKCRVPKEWVQQLALAKAKDVARFFKSGLVIGADTIVLQDNEILGKPRNVEEAKNMLNLLSGATHQVLTGIALVDALSGKTITDVENTLVRFRELTEGEIDAYIASGEPMDKAGAYGIQGLGALFVEGISGCYFNVVGLPLNRLAKNLKHFGVEIL
ncbi:MAG: Maf family protein [Peptococcales bacterium]|jgi:septum formation protein